MFKMPGTSNSSKRRKVTTNGSDRKNFKWEPHHMNMAVYIKDHYETYKKSLASSRKMEFLRNMQLSLGVTCTDTQLKNGFYNFLKKYQDLKQKLNSSGFGMDPEKDKTLNQDVILKACPYFYELDEVMGSRPNVAPPFIVSTAASTTEKYDDPSRVDNTEASNCISDEGNSSAEANELLDVTSDDEITAGSLDGKEGDNSVPETVQTDNSTLTYVKQALSGISGRKKRSVSDTPVGMFAKAMEEKTASMVKVEQDKLSFMRDQEKTKEKVELERIKVERSKVELQKDLENEKIALERERMAERRDERAHELKILEMKQQFELKKLGLL